MEHSDWTRDPLVQSECSIQQKNGISRDPDVLAVGGGQVKVEAALLHHLELAQHLEYRGRLGWGPLGQAGFPPRPKIRDGNGRSSLNMYAT